MAGIAVKVDNKGEIDGLIKRLGNVATGANLKGVLKRASPPLVSMIASTAPVRYGFLGKATTHVQRWYPRNKIAVSVIGAGADKEYLVRKKKIVPWRYAHLAEKGSKAHSLTTAVDMKLIRRGKGPWKALGEIDLRGAGKRSIHEVPLQTLRHWKDQGGVPAVRARVYTDSDVTSRARELARDYLYRRDKKAGKRVHPGAKATNWMQKASDVMAPRIGQSIAEDLNGLIRKAAG